MPDISSVDQAVEKLVQEAPPLEETPVREAPVESDPVKPEKEGAAPVEAPDLSAFEQELIEEFKDEYEQVPEAERPKFLAALKRSYRKQAKQMTELGTLRKAVSALREAGVTNEDLVELVSRKRGNGQAPTPSSPKPGETATERGYQRWLAKTTDPAEREQLREAEQVVREVVDDLVTAKLAEIREHEVKPLRERLDWQDRQALTKRAQTLDQEINDLEDKLGYPGSLVETHRATMQSMGLREPTLTAEDLLVRVAGFPTVKAAMLKASANAEAEKAPAERPKTPPGSVIKKPGQAEMPRKPSGVVSITRALDQLLNVKR